MNSEVEKEFGFHSAQACFEALANPQEAVSQADYGRLISCAIHVMELLEKDMENTLRELISLQEEVQQKNNKQSPLRKLLSHPKIKKAADFAKAALGNLAVMMVLGKYAPTSHPYLKRYYSDREKMDALQCCIQTARTFSQCARSAGEDLRNTPRSEKTVLLLRTLTGILGKNREPFSAISKQDKVAAKLFYDAGYMNEESLKVFFGYRFMFFMDMTLNFFDAVLKDMGWRETAVVRFVPRRINSLFGYSRSLEFTCRHCGYRFQYYEESPLRKLAPPYARCDFCGGLQKDKAYHEWTEKSWLKKTLFLMNGRGLASGGLLFFGFILVFSLALNPMEPKYIPLLILLCFCAGMYLGCLIHCNAKPFLIAYTDSLRRTRSPECRKENGLEEVKTRAENLPFPLFFLPSSRRFVQERSSLPLTRDEWHRSY